MFARFPSDAGNIVWVVLQSRLPRGSQKLTEALLEILTYGLLNPIVWTLLGRAPITWVTWPTNFTDSAWPCLTVFVTPIDIALRYEVLLRWLADHEMILPLEPRAWERLFLVTLTKKSHAAITTLQTGTKIAGAYINTGYAGLYPYDSDLFLSEVWQLDDAGRFICEDPRKRGRLHRQE